MLYAVIMAGGRGERLWPKSRKKAPKQLLPFTSRRSMVEETVRRFDGVIPPGRIYVITSKELLEPTRKVLPHLPEENIVAEPECRNTAACIGLAAVMVRARPDAASGEATLAVLPADHAIKPKEKFLKVINVAREVAKSERTIVTLGIVPAYPHTGYGYIKRGRLAFRREGFRIYQVDAFKEKPDPELAEEFVASKEYYWNSGIFVALASVFIEAISRYLPRHGQALKRIASALGRESLSKILAAEYARLDKVSIDYGVLEKACPQASRRTEGVQVVETDFLWNDVGSWNSLMEILPHGPDAASGNLVRGSHFGLDTRDSIIVGEPGHLIATIGLSDIIVVHTPDATLVCPRKRSQDVKALVERLEKEGFNKYL